MRLKLWDSVSFVCVWIAAILLALDGGLKNTPHLTAELPNFMGDGIWPFVPLALLFVSAVIFLIRQFSPAKSVDKNSVSGFSKLTSPYAPIPVVGKKFINERVPLDGYSYLNCEMTNVTFVYQGTTPIQLNHNEINGRIQVHTDSPVVGGAFTLLQALGMLPGGLDFEEGSVASSSTRSPMRRPRQDLA